MEIFKKLTEFPNYSVSNEGRVRNDIKDRILSKNLSNKGYERVKVKDVNGEWKSMQVHYLVGITFCNGYNDGFEIDHINGIRDDNRASNLRWVSHKENVNNPITRKRFSESRMGEKHFRYGKHLSDETKQKLSNAHKGKHIEVVEGIRKFIFINN